mmetsp:Transcript_11247/g.16656  ORF Transcript_11247/g.16656 Transcript_11247/m.16656 type:complete len:395 (+) Transcript_11247:88-1272(+)|eukprot:CAMPEP_0202437386 /NCGR_PEP_ID=MMETSP1345-20130828/29238_1 /ASSEMBLY_ACC=CAM_ASM_000843 /TAXON_ID=342563 /ORGANISM="Fabrea Fabrea salina" /LENGTH=394 /DNA_ID=CAMNT_0049051133 /DNA_START=50 /DNA_END=1234 /DNA_ORIENTATION=+
MESTRTISIEELSSKMDYVTSDAFFGLNSDQRRIEFELNHFQKYHKFANPNFQRVYEEYANALKEYPEAVREALAQIEEETRTIIPYDQIAKELGKEAAGLMLQKYFNQYLARQIVENSVKGGVDYLGRRGAVVVVDQTLKLTASQAAANTVKSMRFVNALPGIGATIGENLAGLALDAAGVDNYVLRNAGKLGGSIAGGAATGAAIGAMGGPVGVAAGAAAGIGAYATGQVFQGLFNTGFGRKGPEDNWAYIEIGNLKDLEVCIGTYKANDEIYFHTYSKEYKSKPGHFVISAGQPQNESFQVTVWRGERTLKHLARVYYGDFIRVYCCGERITLSPVPDSKKKKSSGAARRSKERYFKKRRERKAAALEKFGVLHAKGSLWGDQAGTVEVFK